MLEHDHEAENVLDWLSGRVTEAAGGELGLLDAEPLLSFTDTGSVHPFHHSDDFAIAEAITHTRRNVWDMSAAEHRRLLAALSSLNTSANPAWGRFVFLHRVVGSIVHSHAQQRFLPWHRLMLWKFERLIRSTSEGAGLSIPYWTWWQEPTTGRKGLPPIFADFMPSILMPTMANADFARTVGSLFASDVRSALGLSFTEMINLVVASVLDASGNSMLGTAVPVTRIARATLLSGDTSTQGRQLPSRTRLQTAMARTVFTDFSTALENVHGSPHMWIGDNGRADGRMADVEMSPADILFYFHHAEVDRLWHLWQARTGVRSSWTVTGSELPPWSETIAQSLNIAAVPLEFAYQNRSIDDPARTP